MVRTNKAATKMERSVTIIGLSKEPLKCAKLNFPVAEKRMSNAVDIPR
jgi:hypothetical protein